MSTSPKKRPVIRKGQKSPYRKATNAQIELRVEQCARWLAANQLTTSEINRKAKAMWGVNWRTTAIYIGRGRKLILNRIGKTKDDVFAEAVMFYEGVIRSDTATWTDKTKARIRLDELFAINPPRIVHQRLANETDKPFKVEETTQVKSPFSGVSPELVQRLLAALPPEEMPLPNECGTAGEPS